MRIEFNRNIDALKPSSSIALMEKARMMSVNERGIISLAGGEPDFDTPPRASFAGIQSICRGQTHYTSGRGMNSLRERIARKLNEENNIACDVENILMTPGGKFAIYVVLRTLLNGGDEVIILDPSWVSYAPIVIASGGVPVRHTLKFTDNYRIDAQDLRKSISSKSKAIIINSPNNPTGRMLSPDEVRAIAQVAHDNDMLILSDEIYEKIIYDQNRHISIASDSSIANQVVTVNGFSKFAAMTGWRIGYLAANKILVDKVYALYQHVATCISEFVQEAALVAIDCDSEIEEMRKNYQERRNFFVKALNDIPGVICRFPEGAFYAWAMIDKDGLSSEDVSDFLLEKAKVVVVPGTAYGGEEGSVRMSFASPMSDLQQAADRIREAMKQMR